MNKIIVISMQDVDVSKGLKQLLDKYPKAKVWFPVTGDEIFFESVIQSCQDKNASFHCFIPDVGDNVQVQSFNDNQVTVCSDPIKEILRQVSHDDVLAIVWDDGIECHMVLHSVEDYGLETWDITDGIDPIEIDYSDSGAASELFSDMMDTMQDFVEKMSLYLTATILEALNQVIGENLDRLKDIDPFEE
jgi:hypothetical protein